MENEKKQPMTFRELKEFVNGLNDTQLDCNVVVYGEETGTFVYSADVEPENRYYQYDDPENQFLEKDFREGLADPDTDIKEEDFEMIPAGTPRLWNWF